MASNKGKFKVLNKSGYDKSKIDREQVRIKGKPYKYDDVVVLDLDANDTMELIGSKSVMPADDKAKEKYPNFDPEGMDQMYASKPAKASKKAPAQGK